MQVQHCTGDIPEASEQRDFRSFKSRIKSTGGEENKLCTSEISIGVIIPVGEKEEWGRGEINLQCYREIFRDTYASH